MATRIRRTTTSFAINSVDRVVGRIYTAILILLGSEMGANAFAQATYAAQPLFWLVFGAVMATFLGTLWNFWFGRGLAVWYRIHSLTFFAAILIWPLQIPDPSLLPDNFHPWMWWGLAIVLIGLVASLRHWLGVAVLVSVPVCWFLLRQQPEYGNAGWFLALQDSLYIGLFSAAVTVLIQFTRSSANKVDVASQIATDIATERAGRDAMETERARVDALVHDSVLTTLLVAANAKTPGEQVSAASLAKDALERLEEARTSSSTEKETTSAASFIEALATAVERLDGDFLVSRSVVGNVDVPGRVASALTEATLQAAANSLQHAGNNVSRELHLKATAKGVKIVVKDDGRGFRPSRVPKNRLGIRLSIRSRMDLIGGKTWLDSTPGAGTTVILEWAAQ